MTKLIAALDSRPYRFTIWCISLFLIFTIIAMLSYSGGTWGRTDTEICWKAVA